MNDTIQSILDDYNVSDIQSALMNALISNDIDNIKIIAQTDDLPITWSVLYKFINKDSYDIISPYINVDTYLQEEFDPYILESNMIEIIGDPVFENIQSLLESQRINILESYIDYLKTDKKLFVEYKNIIADLKDGNIDVTTFPIKSIKWLLSKGIIKSPSIKRSLNLNVQEISMSDNDRYIILALDDYDLYRTNIHLFGTDSFTHNMYSIINGKILDDLLIRDNFCMVFLTFLRSELGSMIIFPSCYDLVSKYMDVKYINNDLKLYMISICLEHGYVDLLHKYMNKKSFIQVIARSIVEHPDSYNYIINNESELGDSSILKYTSQNIIETSSIWNSLLIESIKGNNVFVVSNILKIHKKDINDVIKSMIHQIYVSPEMKLCISQYIKV